MLAADFLQVLHFGPTVYSSLTALGPRLLVLFKKSGDEKQKKRSCFQTRTHLDEPLSQQVDRLGHGRVVLREQLDDVFWWTTSLEIPDGEKQLFFHPLHGSLCLDLLMSTAINNEDYQWLDSEECTRRWLLTFSGCWRWWAPLCNPCWRTSSDSFPELSHHFPHRQYLPVE